MVVRTRVSVLSAALLALVGCAAPTDAVSRVDEPTFTQETIVERPVNAASIVTAGDDSHLVLRLVGDPSCPEAPALVETNGSEVTVQTVVTEKAVTEGCNWTQGLIETSIDVRAFGEAVHAWSTVTVNDGSGQTIHLDISRP